MITGARHERTEVVALPPTLGFPKERARATKGRYTILAKIFEKYLDGRPLDGPVPTLASG
jgi:hypothetical protein